MLSLNPHSRTELLRYNKLNADAFTHIYTHSYIILNVHVSSENRAIRFSFWILSAIHEWRGGERSRGWKERKTYCKNHEMKRCVAAERASEQAKWSGKRLHPHPQASNEWICMARNAHANFQSYEFTAEHRANESKNEKNNDSVKWNNPKFSSSQARTC